VGRRGSRQGVAMFDHCRAAVKGEHRISCGRIKRSYCRRRKVVPPRLVPGMPPGQEILVG
jgi:hypothetical protein